MKKTHPNPFVLPPMEFKQEERPVPTPDPVFATFEEWENGAESTYDVQCKSFSRSVYRMLGQTIFEEVFWARTIIGTTTTSIVAVDFNMRADHPAMKLAEKHGGVWEEAYYAEDGMGWPRFSGDDAARQCWNFLTEYKADEWKRTTTR